MKGGAIVAALPRSQAALGRIFCKWPAVGVLLAELHQVQNIAQLWKAALTRFIIQFEPLTQYSGHPLIRWK
jgi:hypothetical protein